MAPGNVCGPGCVARLDDQASSRLFVLKGCAVVVASGEMDLSFT
jgi:hypothetical protein